MKNPGLSLKEIDGLLEQLYRRLKGKDQGLPFAEPVAILLAGLKTDDNSLYSLQLPRFSSVMVNALISGAWKSFGYAGLESLSIVAGDIPLVTDIHRIDSVETGMNGMASRLAAISAILDGREPQPCQHGKDDPEPPSAKQDFFRESITGSIGLPLVSTFGTGTASFSTGRVVTLQAKLVLTGEWSLRRKHEPAVHFEHISAEPDSPFEQQIFLAIKEAEKTASSKLGMPGLQRIPREYRISLPELASLPSASIGMMSGGSAGLGMTALAISLLGGLDLCRKSRLIPEGTAFTGMIDDKGNVLPVAGHHLDEKVRSVFFSTCSRLAVPSSNMEKAAEELAGLRAQYPARRFELVPVSETADIFGDRKIAEIRNVPAARTILQRLFHWRKHLATGVAALAAAFALLYVLPPYMDRTVARTELVDSLLVMYNKSNHIVADHNIHFTLGKNQNNQLLRFFTVDCMGDGRDETIAIVSEGKISKSNRPIKEQLHIILFDHSGKVVNSYAFSYWKELCGIEKNPYESRMTLLMDSSRPYSDKDGNWSLYLLINCGLLKTSTLVRLSLPDFDRQIYANSGMINEFKFMDLDVDGEDDLVLVGFNYIFESTFMAVLNPKHVAGASPDGYEYPVPGFENDVARYFIKFPDFYRAVPRNEINKLTPLFSMHSGEFSVIVKSSTLAVQYFIDQGLRCQKAIVSEFKSGYSNSPNKPIRVNYEGVEKDEEDLKNGVRYWDGSGWVSEPVINRSKLRTIGEKNEKDVSAGS